MGSSTNKSVATQKKYAYLPKLFIVVVLGFVGILMNSIIRGSLSVAMVAMVHQSIKNNTGNETSSSSECPVDELERSNWTLKKVFVGERYDWDPINRGNIMSAYFYCYFVTVLTGGYLAERYGATRILLGGISLESLVCFFIPLAARSGIAPLIAARSLQGLCGGVALPAMSSVVSKWAPKLERSAITTIIFSGSLMSTVLSNPVNGWLTTINFLEGWPSIFNLSGLSGCIWSIFWFSLVYEKPHLHPTITKDELLLFPEVQDNISSKKHEVPWRCIATSLPFWSVCFAQCGAVFTFNILMVELPTYLTNVLHFDIKASGFLSTLPFLSESVAGYISSFIADRMRKSGRWRITTIRKFFNSIAGYSLSLCLIGITFSGCDSSLIMGLLTFGMFVDGCKFAGFHATTIDMSPDFAGTMYGLSYGMSSIFGISGPQMVGGFTASGATIKNWSKVFYLTSTIKFAVTTFYAVFASAELQPWGKAQGKDIKNDHLKSLNVS